MALWLERLAEAEEELAAGCSVVAARVPEAAAELDELQKLHVSAAASLRLLAESEGSRRPAWQRLASGWVGAWRRLGATTAAWATTLTALDWLRQRELELARRHARLLDACSTEEVRQALFDSRLALLAWSRYMRVERLLALSEYGELAPT